MKIGTGKREMELSMGRKTTEDINKHKLQITQYYPANFTDVLYNNSLVLTFVIAKHDKT